MKDHLGNTRVTYAAAAPGLPQVMEYQHYYPFGMQPRFDRGYTGHEHMAGFGLINMNGRLYDPYLQRFLSPDNIVQSPENAQNYNRYSYCLNNPLMYTDPTGYDYSEWNDNDDVAFGSNQFGKNVWPGGADFHQNYVSGCGHGYVSPNFAKGYNTTKHMGYSVNNGTYYDQATGKVVPFNEVNNNYLIQDTEMSIELNNYSLIPIQTDSQGGVSFMVVEKNTNTISSLSVNISLDYFYFIGPVPIYGENAVGQEGGTGEKLYGANAAVVGTGLSVDVTSNMARYAGEAGEGVRTFAETASRRLIVVSAGITVADAVVKGQWQPHHTADVAISAVFLGASFIPGVNLIVWGAAGALFVTDLAVHHYTGKSVTENLFDSTKTDKTKNP